MHWDEAAHPRDGDGKFTDAPGWIKKLDERITGGLAGNPGWYEDYAQIKRDEHPGLQLELYRASGGHLVLANIRVPQKQQGVGTKIMTEITELADRNGDRLALTPASDYGSSRTRLKQFYKRFGFVENKGRNRDYEISDDMYRLPKV